MQTARLHSNATAWMFGWAWQEKKEEDAAAEATPAAKKATAKKTKAKQSQLDDESIVSVKTYAAKNITYHCIFFIKLIHITNW